MKRTRKGIVLGPSRNESDWLMTLSRDDDKQIRGILYDYGFVFPDWKSFHFNAEVVKPHIFNFFAIHGKLIFISSPCYDTFEIVCRNFDPRELWTVNVERHSFSTDSYAFCRGPDYNLALRRWSACVSDMLEYFNHG